MNGTGQRAPVGRKRATVRSGHRRWNLALRGGWHRTAARRLPGGRASDAVDAPRPSRPWRGSASRRRRGSRRTTSRAPDWTKWAGSGAPDGAGGPPSGDRGPSPRTATPAHRRRPSSRAERCATPTAVRVTRCLAPRDHVLSFRGLSPADAAGMRCSGVTRCLAPRPGTRAQPTVLRPARALDAACTGVQECGNGRAAASSPVRVRCGRGPARARGVPSAGPALVPVHARAALRTPEPRLAAHPRG